MTAGQRGEYQRISGDPLDWVRHRLGHRSVARWWEIGVGRYPLTPSPA